MFKYFYDIKEYKYLFYLFYNTKYNDYVHYNDLKFEFYKFIKCKNYTIIIINDRFITNVRDIFLYFIDILYQYL